MEELLNYMYNLERFGIKLGLETMNSILNLFDNPQNKFKTIHIAGTNGKGSTASFIFNILKQQYSNVGLYTSPHLHQFNERIKINDNFISDEEIVELIKEVKQKSEENNIHLTFFEFTTTIMFLHFARKKVDIAVIEVGMGGRLDATNIITPLISIITNIGLDHTHILGDTKLKIAAEKAGIIKQNIPLITAEKSEEILEFFFEICKQKNSEILEVENYKILSSNLDGQRFIYLGEDYFIKMLGEHQIVNSCIAIETAKKLKIPLDKIKKGLEKTIWNGRLEIISKNPLIIVDGAHNIDGMNSLVEFLKTLNKKIILVIAMSNEKKVYDMTKDILKLCSNVICCEGDYKPMNYLELYDKIDFTNKLAIKSPEEAFKKAKEVLKDEIIVIAGSLYMIGHIC